MVPAVNDAHSDLLPGHRGLKFIWYFLLSSQLGTVLQHHVLGSRVHNNGLESHLWCRVRIKFRHACHGDWIVNGMVGSTGPEGEPTWNLNARVFVVGRTVISREDGGPQTMTGDTAGCNVYTRLW